MERSRAGIGGALWRALRPHQWAKNLLLFVPLALTPSLHGDTAKWLAALAAFAAWSAVASAGYLANDWLDRDSDRRDPAKRERPFANGTLPLVTGTAAALALAFAGLALAAAFLPAAFGVHLWIYLGLTLAYSLYVKRLLLLDVLLLAGLYTLRLLAGGTATGIALTPWLLAFSLFFFLGLAFAKRYVELRRAPDDARRAYRRDDLDLVMMLGTASVYASVLVLCLYINTDHVGHQYVRPGALWFLAPILLYWVSRIWFLALRGDLRGDPVAFAVRDRASFVAGALVGAVLVIAAGRWP